MRLCDGLSLRGSVVLARGRRIGRYEGGGIRLDTPMPGEDGWVDLDAVAEVRDLDGADVVMLWSADPTDAGYLASADLGPACGPVPDTDARTDGDGGDAEAREDDDGGDDGERREAGPTLADMMCGGAHDEGIWTRPDLPDGLSYATRDLNIVYDADGVKWALVVPDGVVAAPEGGTPRLLTGALAVVSGRVAVSDGGSIIMLRPYDEARSEREASEREAPKGAEVLSLGAGLDMRMLGPMPAVTCVKDGDVRLAADVSGEVCRVHGPGREAWPSEGLMLTLDGGNLVARWDGGREDAAYLGEPPVIMSEGRPIWWDGRGRFRHEELAAICMERHMMGVVHGTLRLRDPETGIWSDDARLIDALLVSYDATLTSRQRNEVVKTMTAMSPVLPEAPPRYILLDGQVYDRATRTPVPLAEADPSLVFLSRVPHRLAEPDPEDAERVRAAMAVWSCGDPDWELHVAEMMGACLARECVGNAFFILSGAKGNGKSTFVDVLQRLVGDGNYSVQTLHAMTERFGIFPLVGKSANLCDEIASSRIGHVQAAVVKKMTDGATAVSVEGKGRDAFDARIGATLVWTANQVPAITDETGAVADREHIIPFDARLRGTSAEASRRDLALTGEGTMRAWLSLALDGLARLDADGEHFSPCDRIDLASRRQATINDPVGQMVAEQCAGDLPDGMGEPMGLEAVPTGAEDVLAYLGQSTEAIWEAYLAGYSGDERMTKAWFVRRYVARVNAALEDLGVMQRAEVRASRTEGGRLVKALHLTLG